MASGTIKGYKGATYRIGADFYDSLSGYVSSWVNTPVAMITEDRIEFSFMAQLATTPNSLSLPIFTLKSDIVSRIDTGRITQYSTEIVCGSGNNYDGSNVRACTVLVNSSGLITVNNGVNQSYLPFLMINCSIPLKVN